MKEIQLQNIDIELFEISFSRFKKCVTSDLEFDFDARVLKTKSIEFDKGHLVALGSFYGGDQFIKRMELVINQVQKICISFEIGYNLKAIDIWTDWGDDVEFNPANLYSAELYWTDKLGKVLSVKSKQILKGVLPDFDFNQSAFKNNKRYAYFVLHRTLVLILVDGDNAEISHLFNVGWNEIQI